MRTLVAAVLLSLAFAPAAEAKLDPAFSQRAAEAGDVVELDVGARSEQFPGPLRIYLVPLELADQVRKAADPRLVEIGELGTPGHFGSPRVLRFEVPRLPPGDYTAAIWFKGYATGTWANALEGIHPLLTIGPADEPAASAGRSAGRSEPSLWAVVLAVGGLGAGLVACRWRRATRRPARGALVS